MCYNPNIFKSRNEVLLCLHQTKAEQKCQMYMNTYKLCIHITTQIFKNTKNSLQYFDGFCFEKFRVMYQNKFNI